MTAEPPAGRGIAGRLISIRGWRRRLLSFVLGALAAAAQSPVHLLPILPVSFCGLVWLLDGAQTRREAFGGRTHDDLIARLRLAQAYGRLIRRKGDRGVFVVLDAATPTRLFGAFPEGVVPERVGLVEAIEASEEFLAG